MQRRLRHAETQCPAGSQARCDQILDDFVLRVDRDRMAGKSGQVDTAPLAFESQFKTVMQRPFGLHARADTCLGEQVHRALFEDAGADGGFDLFASARFEYDRVDAAQVKKMGKKQACRPGTNDANLGAHELSPECGV